MKFSLRSALLKPRFGKDRSAVPLTRAGADHIWETQPSGNAVRPAKRLKRCQAESAGLRSLAQFVPKLCRL
jgi:hypothetical protein